MAVLRKHDDGTLTIVTGIPKDKEQEFYDINKDSGLFVYVDDSQLPESRYGIYKYDENGNIIVDEEKELELYKQDKLNELNQVTQDYILSHYPIEKQNADTQQKDYFGTALLMIRNNDEDESTPNLTVDEIYQMVGKFVNDIFTGTSTLQDIVSQFPVEEQYYWEQLIKAGCRKAWVIRCVYVFNDLKNKILNATSFDEIDSLGLQCPDFPEFPEL